MDPKEIRKRLGLPEDASDEQVQETLKGLNEAAGVKVEQEVPAATATTTTTETTTEGTPAATTETTTEQAAPAAQPAAVAASVPAGMVMIDEKTLDALKTGASAGLEIKAKTEERERTGLVSAAISDGRIAPASREHWLNLLEKDPTAKETLESLAKGLIPVQMREVGHGGGGAEGVAASGELDPETVHAWSGQLFPEVREMHRRDAALAAGSNDHGRPRVSADASYRR